MWLMQTAFKICFPPSGVKAVARDIVRTIDDAAASGLASDRPSAPAASPMYVTPGPKQTPTTHNWILLAFWVLIAVFSFTFTYGIPYGLLIVTGLVIYFKVTSKQQRKQQAQAIAAAARRQQPAVAPPEPAVPPGSGCEPNLSLTKAAPAVLALPAASSVPPPPGVPAGWYPRGDVQQYWDGSSWTDHTAPLV